MLRIIMFIQTLMPKTGGTFRLLVNIEIIITQWYQKNSKVI